MESVMSDFLTRLVAATYTPAVSMRPRPVAHYEPMAAPLPIWAPGVEPSPAVAHDEIAEIAAQASAAVKSLDAQGAPAEHSNLSVEKAGEQLRAPAVALPRQTVALHQDATTGRGASLATRAEAGQGAQRTAAGHESIAARSQETAGDRRLAGAQAPQPLQALRPPIRVAKPATIAPAPTAPSLASARRELEPVRPSTAVATHPAAATTLEPNRLHETVAGATPPVSLAAQRQATALAPAISSDERVPPGDRHGHVQPALPSAHQLLAAQHTESAAPMRDAVSATPPAPVIRVTIGRIVVKAESAASTKDAPARPTQPGRPALSLDQYLKARSGGDA